MSSSEHYDEVQRGVFVDWKLVDAEYACGSQSAATDSEGGVQFRPGDSITLRLGELAFGSAQARQQMTVADFAMGTGQSTSLRDPKVTNRARLMYALAKGSDRVALTPNLRDVISRYAGGIRFEETEDSFAASPAVEGLLSELGCLLPSGAEARNHLRRRRSGILKVRGVVVPMRDGSALQADVYTPLAGGPHPAIVRLGIYGNAFGFGGECSNEQRRKSERREDEWFEGPRANLPEFIRYSESLVSANTSDWVPQGYALVRINGRGVGASSGELRPFSEQEAYDFFDAIEWTAVQPWCDGNVGLLGASYAATVQWNVAVLHPPSLKAMIPFAGDVDAYRELAYPGGIFNEGYRRYWWTTLATQAQCEPTDYDLVQDLIDHPFAEPDMYGPHGQIALTPELEQIAIPFFTAISQTSALHGRGGIEAFRRSPVPDKHLVVVDASYFSFLYEDCLAAQIAFFDRHLRGASLDRELLPPVRYIMRTGGGDFEWRNASAWPLPDTKYLEFFLDASDLATRDTGSDVPFNGVLNTVRPQGPAVASYSAEVNRIAPHTASGVSFLSGALEHDIELAGHFTATLWVSSSAADMDVFISLRVFDSDGVEVSYPVRESDRSAPLTWGCLKVSQRRLDPMLTLPERPYHTHRGVDRSLLTSPDDVVRIDVELLPATGRLAAGHRLRVDVQPAEGRVSFSDPSGRDGRQAYDDSYHSGATNRLHTGGDCPSVVRVPVVYP